jgi:broad specificity phosphatase PhoE
VPNIIIHCIRHAQGYHNLNEENHKLHDPSLTPFGESQCQALQKVFPYHEKITHLVASPLRRTIYTCLLSFEAEVKSGKKIIALPELQETSDLPCDTGSDPAKLQEEFGTGKWKGTVDLSLVREGWNYKSPNTRWAPRADKIEVRAREARRWLRDLGKQFGGDAEIVVVTHGGYLHYFTEDWTGHNKFAGKYNHSSIFCHLLCNDSMSESVDNIT